MWCRPRPGGCQSVEAACRMQCRRLGRVMPHSGRPGTPLLVRAWALCAWPASATHRLVLHTPNPAESLSTLKFANRAKCMRNLPKVGAAAGSCRPGMAPGPWAQALECPACMALIAQGWSVPACLPARVARSTRTWTSERFCASTSASCGGCVLSCSKRARTWWTSASCCRWAVWTAGWPGAAVPRCSRAGLRHSAWRCVPRQLSGMTALRCVAPFSCPFFSRPSGHGEVCPLVSPSLVPLPD